MVWPTRMCWHTEAVYTDLTLAEPRRRVTLDEVRQVREQLYAAARANGIASIRVFGSVARGDADENSDLDLLVEIEPGRGLFAMGEFAFAVQELLGVFTQVVTIAGLKARLHDRVLAESVPV